MVLCMFEITRIEWGVPIVLSEQLFVFLASLAAYNFVKYSNLATAAILTISSTLEVNDVANSVMDGADA